MSEGAGREVGKISIKVTPNLKTFYSDLKAKIEEVERKLKGSIPFDIDIDAAGAKAQMRAVMAELKAEGAKGVAINTRVDSNLIRNQMTKALGGLEDSLSNLGNNASGISEGIGKNGMAGNLALLAVAAAAAAPAVGLIAGVLAGLPSIAVAGGAGIGAIALGLDGIKKAAEPLKPALDALKASVSGVFEQRLTPIFDQLKGVFPVLQTAMAPVANGLSDIAQSLTNVVTSSAGLGAIQRILSETGSLFSQMAPIAASFAQSFLSLANSGANSFGLLLAPLRQFGDGFAAVVQRITSNGAFEGAMKGLSQVLGSVTSLFNRLFESGVTAMGQLGGPLTTLIDGLGNAFVALMPALTSFSGLIGTVLGTALNAIAPAVTALTPAFTTLASTLGTMLTSQLTSLAPVLTQIASALSGALLTAIAAVQPVLPGLLAAFQQLTTVVSGQLAQYLPQIAQSFGQMLGAILPIMPRLLELGAVIATAVIPAVAKLAPVVAGVVGAIAGLVSALSNAEQAFLTMCNNAVAAVSALPGQITAILSGLASTLTSIGTSIMQGLANGIRAGVGLVKAAVEALAGLIPQWAKNILGIHSPSTVFADIGQNVTQGLVNGLKAGAPAATKQMKTISDQLKDAFDPGKLVDMGANFGKANLNQFESDLGFSGNGVVEALQNYGMDFGTGLVKSAISSGLGGPNAATQGSPVTINVSSADEALAMRQNLVNKQALQYKTR
jgi:phage-related protein